MTRDRVYLIGPRGGGKTTVGRLLAELLTFSFVDADAEFESRAGTSIANVFAAEGEAVFRRLESELLTELAFRDRHVISCGGGAVLRRENRELLRSTGYCVWLTADLVTLCERLKHDPTTAARRPALTELPAFEEMQRILCEREPLYREVAHLTVATDGMSPESVVSAILSAWSTSGCTSR
jgi:shikimate kinase